MRKKAGGVSPEEIEKARSVDLLSYLRACDPGELVHVSGSTYCTRSHDSLKIRNAHKQLDDRALHGAEIPAVRHSLQV